MVGAAVFLVAAGALLVTAPWSPSPDRPKPAAGDDTAASRFAVGTVRLLVHNEYAAAWPSLHPSHRKAVGSRANYVRCETMTRIPIATTSILSGRVRDVTTFVAGLGIVPTKEILLRIVFRAKDGSGTTVTVRHPVHVLQVDGQWRWVLTNESYENYRSGDCGIATAPSPGYEA